MKRLQTAILTAMMLTSCGGHHPETPERPGTGQTVSPELSDGSMRICGSLLTLSYDDGGILFSRNSNGVISAVRLADECRFDFDPSVPELKVNGVAVGLAGASPVQEKESAIWYRLDLTAVDDPVYIIITADL